MLTILMIIKQIFLALDQGLNSLFYSSYDCKMYGYGFGYSDETLSARCWRLHKNSSFWNCFRLLVDFLFFFDVELSPKAHNGEKMHHCESSYWAEVNRKNMPPSYTKYKNDFQDKDEL